MFRLQAFKIDLNMLRSHVHIIFLKYHFPLMTFTEWNNNLSFYILYFYSYKSAICFDC